MIEKGNYACDRKGASVERNPYIKREKIAWKEPILLTYVPPPPLNAAFLKGDSCFLYEYAISSCFLYESFSHLKTQVSFDAKECHP